ncbi:SOS response-associated peptidase [Undibacterium sp. RTI2.1]|uniref:SOS response-associated peptidase n=1 Tax=unclassified Undibacterium TaxID=2630295 RepID=UPI002B228C7E|nr:MULTISPECIES: SOS response-associated peptidase [unclassified Undibacterium]MEB0033116.1 SOS response-associated peptidase [Undibacterium sp. RTI2.1]MEB0118285.1 SOS response-associated peptidase [Undibacterium sp. RTI2.2]
MCGRFALAHPKPVLQDWMHITTMPDFLARYNIAPSTKIMTVRDTKEGRIGTLMRWGLVPPWAADASKLPMLNNARGETITEKPMFKQAVHRRRCIIPISGFYEWQALPGQKTKQPFYILFKDKSPMALAGIWETSKLLDGESGQFLDTCTIVTIGSNALVAPIHDRMPVILAEQDWDLWLMPEPLETSSLMPLIKPYEAHLMQAWCVSTEVNRMANDSAALIAPVLI